jgi:hypothetical protein
MNDRQAVDAGIAEATRIYCDRCEDIRPLLVADSSLKCRTCGFAVAPLYMSETGQKLNHQDVAEATHTRCPAESRIVPLLFSDFNLLGANDDSVGGDVVCPKCYFIIATLDRKGTPEELRRIREAYEKAGWRGPNST